MKRIVCFYFVAIQCFLISSKVFSECYISFEISDLYSLPLVLPINKADLIYRELRNEVVTRFAVLHLPTNLNEWELHKKMGKYFYKKIKNYN